jgi:aminopeptidase
MNNTVRRHLLSLVIVVALMNVASAQQTPTQLAQTAEKAVSIAKIKPNEVVVIRGNSSSYDFLEALAIAAAKAGGRPIITTTSDTLQRAMLADVPEQYLGEPSPWLPMLPNVDVWLATPQIQDPKAVFAGVPETKIAKASASGAAFRDAVNKAKGRTVFVSLPTKRDAELAQLDPNTYDTMQWNAINTDYQQIASAGTRIKNALASAKSVHVTSPTGTDFTFSVGTRPIFINAGSLPTNQTGPASARAVSLPGGDVTWAPVEDSGNGTIIAPKDTCRPYEPLTGSKYQFKNGKMVNFTADNPQCFQELMAPYTGDKDKLASVTIGLNPALKVTENPGDYRPTDAAGMVWIGLGDNQTLGGSNRTESFWSIPVVNATVEIDGNPIVRNGQLVP